MATNAEAWKLVGLILVMIFILPAANVVHAIDVTATIPVGTSPTGAVYDSAMGEIFVANSGFNTVSVISDSTKAVVKTVTVGISPAGLAYDSAMGEIFVTNHGSNSISIISDSTNEVIETAAVGAGPAGLAYDFGKNEIFVVNQGDNTVSILPDSNTPASPNPTPSASANATNSMSPAPITSDTTSPSANPTSSPAQTTFPISSPDLLQQVWVPQPANAAAAIGVSILVIAAVSLVFSSLRDPFGGVGGKVAERTKDLIPDKIKDWLQEVVSSRRKVSAAEKTSSLFRPTKLEAIAYITSIVVLAISFSYVKVISLSQIWELLPAFFATSVLVGFVQKFFSIAFMRSRGVWSEHKIWPLGLVLFLFTTFAFKVPFSSPTRNVHQSKKFTERLGAIVSTSEILINLAFAGLFFLLLIGGYTGIGGAGLAMCVIGSLCGTFPVPPMSGKDIFDYSKRLWAALLTLTVSVFVAWVLAM